MARVRFEKFVDGVREQSFAIPMFALRLFVWLLPASAMSGLHAKGLDLRAIVNAGRDGVFYRKAIEIREHGVDKRLVVSLA